MFDEDQSGELSVLTESIVSTHIADAGGAVSVRLRRRSGRRPALRPRAPHSRRAPSAHVPAARVAVGADDLGGGGCGGGGAGAKAASAATCGGRAGAQGCASPLQVVPEAC